VFSEQLVEDHRMVPHPAPVSNLVHGLFPSGVKN
jgi:hypothetical protein